MEGKAIIKDTEVLIFNFDPRVILKDKKPIKGVVQNIENSEMEILKFMKEQQTSEKTNIQIYEVLGEDGVTYTGYYNLCLPNEICFLTIEDYKKMLYKTYQNNDERVQQLYEENRIINRKLYELKNVIEKQKLENQAFNVYTVPNDKAFVVSSEKTEEFLNQKPNLEIRKEQQTTIDEISNNIKTEIPVLKKTKKK